MTNQSRKLKPGRDYRSAPLHKVARARLLTGELRESYQEYRYHLGEEIVTRLERDRRTARFYARIESPPPLAIWTSLYADIVHNYRSALDGFAWELAHLDGATPPKPSQLYFPIFDSKAKWEAARITTLSSMPRFVLDRLNQVQPFHVQPVKDGIGLLLHSLDNQDKHRSEMRIDLKARDKVHWAYSIRYAHSGDSGGLESVRWLGPDETVFDGMPFAEMQSRFKMEQVGGYDLPLVMTVNATEQGLKFEKDAFHILRLMDEQIMVSFEIVSTGTLSKPGSWLASIGLKPYSVN